MYVLFFFFKQKTAYDVRISDWSSDVCSSDLGPGAGGGATGTMHRAWVCGLPGVGHGPLGLGAGGTGSVGGGTGPDAPGTGRLPAQRSSRSAARRGGKECVSTCRSRWAPSHSPKKTICSTATELTKTLW